MLWVVLDRDCKYNHKYRHMRPGLLDKLKDDDIVDLIASMPESCVLDVAERGGHTADYIAKLVGLSHQRIHAMEVGIHTVKGYIERAREAAQELSRIRH